MADTELFYLVAEDIKNHCDKTEGNPPYRWHRGGAHFFTTRTSPSGPFDAIHGPKIVVYARPGDLKLDFRVGGLADLEALLSQPATPAPSLPETPEAC